MEKKFIGAGLLAGLIASVVSFIFARVFIEPQVAKAIDYEGGRGEAEEALAHHGAEAAGHGGAGHHAEGAEVFSRGVQENIGAATGTVMFTVCMGAFVAVALTVLWTFLVRRYPDTDARWVAAALSGVGFIAFFAVPFFAYPANPPAVGDDDTVGARTAAFLTITVVSVAFAAAGVALAVWLRPKIGGLLAGIAGGAMYLLVVGVTIALLPSFHEVPEALVDESGATVFPGFPGGVIGDFRVYVVANQIILWTVLALALAVLIGRILGTQNTVAQRRVASVSG